MRSLMLIICVLLSVGCQKKESSSSDGKVGEFFSGMFAGDESQRPDTSREEELRRQEAQRQKERLQSYVPPR